MTYTFTDGNGCENSATLDMIVWGLPQVTFVLGDMEACVTESGYDLSGSVSPSGGYFVGTGVNGNIFDANVAGVGVHELIYGFTDSNGCNVELTQDITVHDLPDVTLEVATNSVCEDETSVALTGLPSGGTYTGTAVTGASFDVTSVAPGTYTITYTYIDDNGCENSATADIAVHALPQVTLSLPDVTECVSSTFMALSGGTPEAGVFSGPGVTGTTFDASSAGVGSHTVVYTYTDVNGCVDSADAIVTVQPLPEVTLELTQDEICANEPGINLSGGLPNGGTYSGPGVNGTFFDATQLSVGTHQVTYTFADNNGCINSVTDEITIHNIPAVDFTLDEGEVCLGDVITLSGASPAGGTYSGPGVIGTAFDASAAGPGIHTISYVFTDDSGCSRTATDFIQVFDGTSVQLNIPDDQVCLTEGLVTLEGGLPAGGTYSGLTVTGGMFDPSVAGTGVHDISYTFIDNDGCANTAIDQITVLDPPMVSLDLPQSEICNDEFGLTLSGGTVSYTHLTLPTIYSV